MRVATISLGGSRPEPWVLGVGPDRPTPAAAEPRLRDPGGVDPGWITRCCGCLCCAGAASFSNTTTRAGAVEQVLGPCLDSTIPPPTTTTSRAVAHGVPPDPGVPGARRWSGWRAPLRTRIVRSALTAPAAHHMPTRPAGTPRRPLVVTMARNAAVATPTASRSDAGGNAITAWLT